MSQLPAMAAHDVHKVQQLESQMLGMSQVAIETDHYFHAGLYARSIRIPAGVLLTGALIKIPTLLVVSGHVTVFIGGETVDLQGYQIVPGQAGRKQAFLAHIDTDLTMMFATSAKTVEQAEEEFTAETHLLMSRQHGGSTFTEGE